MVCEANGLTGDARRAYSKRRPRSWPAACVVPPGNGPCRAGQIEEALAAIDRTIALDGAYAPAQWRRGLWLLEAGTM